MSVVDYIFIGIFLFVFAIGIIFITQFMQAFTETSRTSGLDSANAQSILGSTNNALANFNFHYVFIAVGLFVGVVFSAFAVKTHPIFFIPAIFALAITAMLYANLSNILIEVAASPGIESTAVQFPNIIDFWRHAPTILVVIGFVGFILLYSKRVEE